ncbi:MAG TPA: MFS transporter [Victivallales bacterium]|nr:MFS transporter [Victivallales bacterium]
MDIGNDRKNFFHLAGSGAAIIAVTYGLCRYSYGLFLPDIQHTFGLNVEWLGIIGSSSYLGYLIASLLTGIFTKKFGPKIPLIISGVTAVTGSLLIALSFNSFVLFAGVCIAGMSPAFSFPPLTEYVTMRLKGNRKNKAIAIINSGTSYGIILAAPFVLLLGFDWRAAWFIFAIIAACVLVWNYRMTTIKSPYCVTDKGKNCKVEVFKYDIRLNKLFISMLLSGIVFAAFWTYSVDYIDLSSSINILGFSVKSALFSEIFWLVMGASGLLSVYAYTAIKHFGLRKSLQYSLITVAVSTLILAIFHSNGILLLISGFMFGIAFQMFTAFSVIWGIRILKDSASLITCLVLIAMAIGLLVGPIVYAPIINCYSISSMFYIAGVLGILISFIKPSQNLNVEVNYEC